MKKTFLFSTMIIFLLSLIVSGCNKEPEKKAEDDIDDYIKQQSKAVGQMIKKDLKEAKKDIAKELKSLKKTASEAKKMIDAAPVKEVNKLKEAVKIEAGKALNNAAKNLIKAKEEVKKAVEITK
jgi:DNA-directed RNA polymerase beta subunit